MSRKRKTVVQEIKEDFQKNHTEHQKAIGSIRKSQELLRSIDAIFAPRLDLDYVFNLLIQLPCIAIKNIFVRLVGRSKDQAGFHASAMEDFLVICNCYWCAFKYVAVWAWFWIKMFFRFLFTELGNAFAMTIYIVFIFIGYLLGVMLLFGIIYLILTH